MEVANHKELSEDSKLELVKSILDLTNPNSHVRKELNGFFRDALNTLPLGGYTTTEDDEVVYKTHFDTTVAHASSSRSQKYCNTSWAC